MTLEINDALTTLAERANKTPEEFANKFCELMLSYSKKYRALKLGFGFSKTLAELNPELNAVIAALKWCGIESVTIADAICAQSLTIINTEEEEKQRYREEEAAYERWIGY